MEILYIISFVIAFVILISIYQKYKNTRKWEEEANFCRFVSVMVIVFILVTIAYSWHDAYMTPYEYQQRFNTVEESKALLITYENTSGIGYGLEALQLKQEITTQISLKNAKLKDIRAYLDSPFSLWKGVMSERCNFLGVEI